MPTITQSNEKARKAVVAFLEGRRLRGHIFGFSSVRPTFFVFPPESPHGGACEEVRISELKAIFFVRDLAGGDGRTEVGHADHTGSRDLEVTFRDGERIRSFTDSFSTSRPGFFMFPDERHSNILRIFVVNQHVREVKLLDRP